MKQPTQGSVIKGTVKDAQKKDARRCCVGLEARTGSIPLAPRPPGRGSPPDSVAASRRGWRPGRTDATAEVGDPAFPLQPRRELFWVIL